jgi:hypothetical protein
MCVTAIGFGLSTPGCSSDCKTYAQNALIINVRDAAGVQVCDAVVTASDGKYSEVLRPFPAGAGQPCTYSGATERKGTYTLSVAAHDQTKVVDNLKVSKDACHVKPINMTVTLDT